MSFNVYYDKEYNCIVGKYSGTLNIDAVKQYASQTLKLSEEYGCKRSLIDLLEAEPRFSITEIYNLPRVMLDIGIGSEWRRAILISGLTDDYYFYETVSVNRGLAVKMFTDKEKALKWLIPSRNCPKFRPNLPTQM